MCRTDTDTLCTMPTDLGKLAQEIADCRERAHEAYNAYMALGEDRDEFGLARAYGMLDSRMHMVQLEIEYIMKGMS